MRASHLWRWLVTVRPQRLPLLASRPFTQISQTLAALGSRCRIARATIGTMNVRASFNLGNHLRIADQFLLRLLLKLHIIRLRRTTTRAYPLGSLVFAATRRACPIEMNVT
jgi:hypothetical protein